ncbi:hypothetical protein [Methylomonas albis]|uniref:Uncharacterized protein n=1 Tax=Methylomonas albis TaxID=1854563 RepID=A0ABR9D344_9GAMM|nr:hypothetical protein [Methylomonas albis]MBD9357539.1 hypothetical protein [Methylomonas albis]CAD6880823.1 hypothetical protein [Methylomonas albis]
MKHSLQQNLFLFTNKQALVIVAYSLIYPLISATTLLYENSLPLSNNFFVLLGILITFPFIPLASSAGTFLMHISEPFMDGRIAYFVGAFPAVLTQAWLLMIVCRLARRWFNSFRIWITAIF